MEIFNEDSQNEIISIVSTASQNENDDECSDDESASLASGEDNDITSGEDNDN